jgi:hypothetical protein
MTSIGLGADALINFQISKEPFGVTIGFGAVLVVMCRKTPNPSMLPIVLAPLSDGKDIPPWSRVLGAYVQEGQLLVVKCQACRSGHQVVALLFFGRSYP